MIERIKTLVAVKNLSMSQLADEIKFSRSSLSHIISERNKPSLDFVMKILDTYSDINPKWLIFGEGTMYSKDMETKADMDIGLFGGNQNNEEIQRLKAENKALNDEIKKLKINIGNTHKREEMVISTDKLPIDQLNKKNRKIIILNNDNTYEEYLPT